MLHLPQQHSQSESLSILFLYNLQACFQYFFSNKPVYFKVQNSIDLRIVSDLTSCNNLSCNICYQKCCKLKCRSGHPPTPLTTNLDDFLEFSPLFPTSRGPLRSPPPPPLPPRCRLRSHTVPSPSDVALWLIQPFIWRGCRRYAAPPKSVPREVISRAFSGKGHNPKRLFHAWTDRKTRASIFLRSKSKSSLDFHHENVTNHI